jgi:hypothetical protein
MFNPKTGTDDVSALIYVISTLLVSADKYPGKSSGFMYL